MKIEIPILRPLRAQDDNAVNNFLFKTNIIEIKKPT